MTTKTKGHIGAAYVTLNAFGIHNSTVTALRIKALSIGAACRGLLALQKSACMPFRDPACKRAAWGEDGVWPSCLDALIAQHADLGAEPELSEMTEGNPWSLQLAFEQRGE